jgi:hypothetical protein
MMKHPKQQRIRTKRIFILFMLLSSRVVIPTLLVVPKKLAQLALLLLLPLPYGAVENAPRPCKQAAAQEGSFDCPKKRRRRRLGTGERTLKQAAGTAAISGWMDAFTTKPPWVKTVETKLKEPQGGKTRE